MKKKLLCVSLFVYALSYIGKAQVYDTTSYVNLFDSVTINWEKLGVSDSLVVKNIKQLTTNPYEDVVQCWGVNPFSKDGKKILYTSRVGANSRINNEIIMMNTDGSEKVRLTMNGKCDSHANFTPDGKSIVYQTEVYTAKDNNEHARIFIAPLDSMIAKPDSAWGKNLLEVEGYPFNDTVACYLKPIISADGSKIAFKKDTDGDTIGGLYVMNIDGTNRICVSDTIYDASHHVWSPSGEWLAFQSCYDLHDSARVFITKADGSIDPIQISLQSYIDSGWCANWPIWSPDGKWISYHVKPGWSDFPNFIALYNVEDQTTSVLIENDSLNICAPTTWDPNGEWLVYKMESNVGASDRELNMINVNTRVMIKLTTGYYDYRPWFSPDGMGILFKEYNNNSRDTNKYGADLLYLSFEKDLVRPVAKAKNITVYVDELCNTTITPDDIDNGSYDNVEIINKSLDISTFDCTDADKDIEVTLTVEDANGNTDQAKATVKVIMLLSTENYDQQKFVIYPNPANNYISINYAGNTNAGISIFDNSGRLVATQNIESKGYIDVSNLNPGLYIIKITADDITETHKISVKR